LRLVDRKAKIVRRCFIVILLTGYFSQQLVKMIFSFRVRCF
jgi:hypothetical protein